MIINSFKKEDVVSALKLSNLFLFALVFWRVLYLNIVDISIYILDLWLDLIF